MLSTCVALCFGTALNLSVSSISVNYNRYILFVLRLTVFSSFTIFIFLFGKMSSFEITRVEITRFFFNTKSNQSLSLSQVFNRANHFMPRQRPGEYEYQYKKRLSQVWKKPPKRLSRIRQKTEKNFLYVYSSIFRYRLFRMKSRWKQHS